MRSGAVELGSGDISKSTCQGLALCVRANGDDSVPVKYGVGGSALTKRIFYVFVKTLGDLGLTLEEAGGVAARTEVLGYAPPPRRQAGRILEGEPGEMVKELVRLLREEAKVL